MQSKSEIDKYLEEGLNFYGLGKFKKAIECWNKVLEIDPDNSLAKDYIESAGGEVSEEEERPPEKLAEPPPRTTAPPPPSPPPPEPDSEEEEGLPERKEELPPITTTATPPPEPDLEAKFNQAKNLFTESQFELAMEMFESILQGEPDNLDVQGYYEMARSQQLKQYKSEVGDLSQIPRVAKAQTEILKLNLDNEEGFILSLIDGRLSYNDVFSLSNMDDFKTYRIICRFLRQGIIGV